MRVTFTTKTKNALSFHIKDAKGITHFISFESPFLYGNAKESVYSTANDDVIEALERSPMFENAYYIASVEKTETEKLEQLEEKAFDAYQNVADKDSIIEVPEVTDRKGAMLWFQRVHQYVIKVGTPNRDIKALAAQKYNVLFPNWK